MLQLRLENSELRSRLDDALCNTDESKSELLQLLEEQTLQSNSLQRKCDELAAGFVEIDKERKALRKSADDARKDAVLKVEQTRNDCDKQCQQLQRHLTMREKEVETLAERIREQERRIESTVGESNDRQAKVDDLEGELEELIGMVENEREEKKKLQGEYERVMDIVAKKDEELGERTVVEQGLEGKLQELQQKLEGVEKRGKNSEEQLTMELEGKDAEIANLLQDKQLTKIEHEQALQTLQDQLEAQRIEFTSQQQNLMEVHKKEKSELANTFQLQIDERSLTIQTLKSDINLLQSNHAAREAEMESDIQKCMDDAASLETKYQEATETISQLRDEMNNLRSTNNIAQEELKAANYLLEKESGELAVELRDTQVQLGDVNDKLSSLQNQYAALQSEHSSLQQDHSEQVSTLEAQIKQMTVDHDEEMTQKSQQLSDIEGKLKDEKGVSNKLREQLRESNIALKEDSSAARKEARLLEQGLESVNERLLAKEEEMNDLRAKHDAMVHEHKSEVESLLTDHAAKVMVIETRGADIVSDLEDAIGELEKDLANCKLGHEQEMAKMQADMQNTMHNLTMDKERVERSLVEQQEKIVSLTAYAKERKEEVKLVKNELARANHNLENATRERENCVANIRDELQNARVMHEREMSDLQNIVEDVRAELSLAKERLSSEDSELARAKATLSERTNLLRDMVQQTTAYQSDYEREHARCVTLEEAAQSYKRQLAEARDESQRLENEVQDKDTHYCDAIRNERQQRKAMESELELSHREMEDARRQRAEMEKENRELKDKVSRQEKYIGRLQEREKQNRRTTMSTTTRSQRPSTAPRSPTRSPVRNAKERLRRHSILNSTTNENDRPNLGPLSSRSTLPQSPSDELTSLLR